MHVSVRLFAILRESAGRDTVDLDLPDGATVAEALRALRREPGLREPLERMHVAMAVNREYADADSALAAGDELVLVPPVSGGAAEVHRTDDVTAAADVHARVTDAPLSVEEVTARVGRPGAGAIVTFQGTTRDVESLEYEVYAEMAVKRIESILRECVEHHRLQAAAAEHRTGTVPLGQPSVIVAVSAAHRGEAFDGAREAIDRIKAEAPIWKQEVEDGKGRWVEGTPVQGLGAPVQDSQLTSQ